MVTATEQAPAVKESQGTRRLLLVDSESDFRFGVDPEMCGVDSGNFGALHDVEFIVVNSPSREVAAMKLKRFISLLSKRGFDITDEE